MGFLLLIRKMVAVIGIKIECFDAPSVTSVILEAALWWSEIEMINEDLKFQFSKF